MEATYNITTDKLKFWPDARLPEEQYKHARSCGFTYWYGQKCFAGKWSPSGEDLIRELGGEIQADDAPDDIEARVERFSKYADNATQAAEQSQEYLAERANTERRQRLASNSIEKHLGAAEHWQRRIAGAIQSAAYREKPEVIARRIRDLEADRRRQLNSFTVYDPQPNAGQGPGEIFVGKGRGGHWSNAEKIARAKVYAERWIAHIDKRLEYENASLEAAGGCFEVLRPVRKKAIQPKGPTKDRTGKALEVMGAVGCRSGYSGPADWWRLILKVNRSTVEVLCPSTWGGTFLIKKVEAYEIHESKTPAQVKEQHPEMLELKAKLDELRARIAARKAEKLTPTPEAVTA